MEKSLPKWWSENIPIVVAHGAGTNSSAMLLGMAERGIIPELILFADTGGERPDTYDFLEKFSTYLQMLGLPAVVIVKKGGMQETLEENCLRKTMLPSIAYGYKSCSEKYKIRAQNKFCRHYEPFQRYWKSKVKLIKAIGYDAGEERRAKIANDREYNYWHPLIEWGWHREECVEILAKHGFKPSKSSCFFCPSMRKPEILELRERYPELMERALAMEANANLTSIKGLGRSYSWREFLAQIDAGKAETVEVAPEMPCGCYDG